MSESPARDPWQDVPRYHLGEPARSCVDPSCVRVHWMIAHSVDHARAEVEAKHASVLEAKERELGLARADADVQRAQRVTVMDLLRSKDAEILGLRLGAATKDAEIQQVTQERDAQVQQIAALRAERDAARQALEDDAADLWKVTHAIQKVIEQRSWVVSSRGSYTWNDDRYRDETRHAFTEVLKVIEAVQPPASRRFHDIMRDVPTNPRLVAAEADAARLRAALEQFACCDLDDGNCASLEVATRRIRALARAALATRTSTPGAEQEPTT